MTTQELLDCTDRYHGTTSEGATGVVCTDPNCPAPPCVVWRAKQSPAPALSLNEVKITYPPDPGPYVSLPTDDDGYAIDVGRNYITTRAASSPDDPPLTVLHRTLQKWVYIDSHDLEVVDVLLAAYLSNRLPGDPLWLFIVGPPSSLKTELLRALRGLSDVTMLSTLSTKTLVSGLRIGGKDHSLLPTFNGKVVLIKDATAILDKPAKEQREIFGTLRDAYDGFSDHGRGNIDLTSYAAKFAMILGVTPVIDRPRQVAESEMGERCLKVRFHTQDDVAIAAKAWENAEHEGEMRAEIKQAIQGFLTGRTFAAEVQRPGLDQMSQMSRFLARMRASVPRDHYHRMTAPPSPEKPARLLKQLTHLLIALAIVRGHTEITAADYGTAWRVVCDSCPPLRLAVFRALQKEGDPMSVRDLSKKARLPFSTTRETAEDLWAVGLLDREGEDGEEMIYSINPEWGGVL